MSLAPRTVVTVEENQLSLIGKRTRRSGDAQRLGAMVAPVASHGGAVLENAELLRCAEAVIAAFGQGEIEQGLTRAQIIERSLAVDEIERDTLERRLEVFIELSMLLPYRDKAHQARYVINTDAVAGQLFFRKGLSAGGIEELLQLLGATADAIESGREDPNRLAAALTEQRGYVEMWTAAVNRLTDTATLPELLSERARHDGERMLEQVGRLVELVVKHHPELRVVAAALSTSAHSYLEATDQLLGRVIDEGAATRNFALLDPSAYAQLAATGTVEQLASVFDGVVWDPPRPEIAATDIVEAMRTYRPRSRVTRHPAVEDAVGDSTDPLEGLEERVELIRRQRAHNAELMLQGEQSVELSAHLRSIRWPGALAAVVEIAALGADDSGYQLVMKDSLIVDPDSHTSWTSDATLRTDPPRQHATAEIDAASVAETTHRSDEG